jgi:DNA polymerase I
MFGGFPVVFGDTEYGTRPDGSIAARCAVFLLEDGTEIRLWEDELYALEELPFDTRNSLFICYSAGAEFGVFLELGLEELPWHVCDLYAECLAITNGRRRKGDKMRLIDMMARYGLEAIDVEEKTEMRELAMRGGPYTAQEKADLLDYCASDVYALKRLMAAMIEGIP